MFLPLSSDCVLEEQAKELVVVALCNELLLSGVGVEVRGVATETLARAKQVRREQLEAQRQKFLRTQLQKYWNR